MDAEHILAIVEQELDRRQVEKQNLCAHRRSGTLQPDYTITCDQCGLALEYTGSDSISSVEQTHIGRVR